MNRFYAWWLVKTGKAIDIWSKSKYPAYILSNLHDSIFIFDDVECHCMEGFLQSLKHQDEGKQRQICKLRGIDAKRISSSDWQRDQIVWWKGKAINRQSEEYVKLITEAYAALYQQNQYFREALLATKGKSLLHSRGKKDPHETILTEKEFCTILTELRDHDRTIGKGNSFIINDIAMHQEFMNKDNNSILEYIFVRIVALKEDLMTKSEGIMHFFYKYYFIVPTFLYFCHRFINNNRLELCLRFIYPSQPIMALPVRQQLVKGFWASY